MLIKVTEGTNESYKTTNINPDRTEAIAFDKWCREHLEVEEIDPTNKDDAYTKNESDNLFKADGSDWFDEEFISEEFLKIKFSTPTSPSIFVIIPALSKVLLMRVKDVPARLRMYERHIVFLDKTMTADEIKVHYFDKFNDSLGRELFALMKIVLISDAADIIKFLQLWSGRNL